MHTQKQTSLLLLLLALCCLMPSPARAQFIQQGNKLVGTGGVGSSRQGYSVSISADGNTAIVGGVEDNVDAGAAWVFTRSGGVWAQQGSKLVGTGAVGVAQQGSSVAISSDGSTAIVGGVEDNVNIGAAWVYTRSGGAWTQQGNKLVGTGAVGFAQQGVSVALSADGNTAIVGGLLDSGQVGAAWVYTRSGGVWTQQGSKLVATDGVGIPQQGVSVSLSADGNTAIVGGPTDNGHTGAAWVYTRSAGVWTQQGSKLVGTGSAGDGQQGGSVSLSADGNTAIVGGQLDNSYVGAAWVYTRSAGVWTQQGSKLVGTGAVGGSWQGWSVSLSGHGNTAIVGGYNDNGQVGAAWVYAESAGVWTQKGSKLVGTGAVGGSWQGWSVSLSGDGNTAIVGGFNDDGQVGAAWVFAESAGVWTQQGSKFIGTGAVGSARQGISVSLSADGLTAIVGGDADSGSVGAAWVYHLVPPPLAITGIVSDVTVGKPVRDVIVKLLDGNGFPVAGIDPTTTDSLGFYSFANLASATYQVMIVDPLGYNVDQNPKVISLAPAGPDTVNFRLTRAVKKDVARDVPYWKHQFDVYVTGRGTAKETRQQLSSYIDGVQQHYTPHFNIFQNLLTFNDWQGVLTVGAHASILARARKQLAALVLNLVSLKIGQYTVVSADHRTAGDVLTYVSSLVVAGGASNDTLARTLARAINQGDTIASGIVPAGNILYKGGLQQHIVWAFGVPDRFTLAQNYPNPFNPTTKIEYNLPTDAHVIVRIYSSLGQELATLLNEVQYAGYKLMEWDASQYSSGVYFYRLEATSISDPSKSFAQTRKMLLIY